MEGSPSPAVREGDPSMIDERRGLAARFGPRRRIRLNSVYPG
jgi:hypothetical protein